MENENGNKKFLIYGGLAILGLIIIVAISGKKPKEEIINNDNELKDKLKGIEDKLENDKNEIIGKIELIKIKEEVKDDE